MTTVTYSVPNIHCGHCVHTIEMELSELPGVQRVSASEAERQVEVVFQPPASEVQIKELLAEISYPIAE